MLIILVILLYLVPSFFCNDLMFDLVDAPNEIELGKPLDVKWKISSNYKEYNFTINMLFINNINNIGFNITTIQSNDILYQNNTSTHFVSTNNSTSVFKELEDNNVLDENVTNQNITEVINTFDYYITTIQIINKQCYFRDTPLEGWTLKAEINASHIKTKKEEQSASSLENKKRHLDCANSCIEKKCQPKKEIINREIENKLTSDKKKEEDQKFPISFIVIFSLILLLSLLVVGVIIYDKKFKKKEDDPIPIFSVEDSSYCYDINNHSPILSNASYHSNGLDKSLLGVNRGNNKNNTLTASPKIMDQARLSVQLHPLNGVGDFYSHSSQHSSKTKLSENSYNKNPREFHKPESNVNYNIQSNFSSPESPNMTALSPISMASTIPFIPSPKPAKKRSSRYENNHTKHPYIYSESAVVIEKKQNNSFLFSESPMLSETKSRISDKHSYVSNHTENDEEAKVLSSKHYVLSNFEGDYEKEELNLHYGDIVSVINILPDGWAYGELLMKYNAYDTDNNVNNMKTSQIKQRKFGYYPIKCLSHEEESDESNSPLKKIEEENQNDLKNLDIKPAAKQINEINDKDNHHSRTKSNNESTSSILKSNMETQDKSVTNKRKSFNNKRTSFLKLFKRKSNDLALPTKDSLLYYNEPNSLSEKMTVSSKDIIISDSDSDTDTVYHDAEDEGSDKNNIKRNSKRISARSSISYI